MTVYYPLLKKGNSEIKALEEVWHQAPSSSMIPIIESPRKKDPAKWKTDFNTLGSYFKLRFKDHLFAYQFSSTFMDVDPEITRRWRGDNSENIIEFMHSKLTEQKNNFIPCVCFDEKEWIVDSLLKYEHNQLIIRLEPYKFDSGLDQFMAQWIIEKFETKFPNAELIFLLDFYDKFADFARIGSLVNFFTSKNKKVIFGATSCPANADKVPYSAFSTASIRNDFETFLTLKEVYPDLNYCDYTVRLKPEPTVDEKKQININNTYLKIFYTSDKNYMIGKSGLISKQTSDTEHISINDVCKLIVQSEEFKGKSFSYGDLKIHECADGSFKINDHQVPIKLGVNHHIHTVLSQL